MEFQFNLLFLGFNLFEGSDCPVFDRVLNLFAPPYARVFSVCIKEVSIHWCQYNAKKGIKKNLQKAAKRIRIRKPFSALRVEINPYEQCFCC